MTESTGGTRFAQALSAAVTEGHLTLEQLSRRLGELGTPLSTATLSYWCCGRSVPTRTRSRKAVTHLESLLDLPPGHLVSALPSTMNARWNPGVGVSDLKAVQSVVAQMGLDLDRHLEARLLTDELAVRQGGTRLQQMTHQLHWVDSAEVSRFLVILPMPGPGARLVRCEARSGARVGQHILVEAAGVVAVEILLEHTMRRGDLGHLRYETEWECAEPVTRYSRRLPIVLGRLALAVSFDDDRAHEVEHVHVAPDGTATRTAIGTGAQVQVCLADAPPGLHRLEW